MPKTEKTKKTRRGRVTYEELLAEYTAENCTPDISEEAYMAAKNLSKLVVPYTCANFHSSSRTVQSYRQRLANNRGACMECAKATRPEWRTKKTVSIKTREKVTETLQSHGAELIEIKPGRKVVYKCSCGNTTESHISNLTRNWSGSCRKCANENNGNKHTIQTAEEIFTKAGAELLPDQKYTNNKTRMDIVCQYCGEIIQRSVKDITRGRICSNFYCAEARRKATNLVRYGVPNVSQLEETKEKTVKTNLERHGVRHHMMVEEIRRRAAATNMARHGLEYSFRSDESIAAGRATNMEKLGVPFPLMAPSIHEKIKASNLRIYGVEYPLQSEEIQQKIEASFQQRYGMGKAEYLQKLCSENREEYHRRADETCMERYGVPLYEYLRILIEENGEEYRSRARATCLERYGVEYPAQCEEIFNKMIASGYSRKEYVFPSGRVEYCQGYEPRCWDYLLHVENVEETSIEVGYSNQPAIWYDNPTTNERSRYYPDGWLNDSAVIIEVKSVYWFEKDLAKNLTKFAAVNAMGKDVWLYVFGGKSLAFKRIYHASGETTTFRECPPEPNPVAIKAGEWWEIITDETGQEHVEIPLETHCVKIDLQFLPIVQQERWRLDTSTKIPQIRSKKNKRRALHKETIATVGELRGIRSLQSVVFVNGDFLDYRLCNLRRK